jgi:hypothetical protein
VGSGSFLQATLPATASSKMAWVMRYMAAEYR